MAGYIEDVGVVHPHLAPHAPVRHYLRPTLLTYVGEKVRHGPPAVVEIVTLDFELSVDVLRVGVCPVGEQQHVLPVGVMTLAIAWHDHDRAVETHLLLKS